MAKLQLNPFSVTGQIYASPFLLCLFLLTLLIGKLFILCPGPKQDLKLLLKCAPKDTAFVFDLHGVVFRYDPLSALQELYQFPHKIRLLQAACNLSLIWDACKLLISDAVVEEAIMNIQTKHPNFQDLIPLALRMANAQVPIPATIQLIEQIKKSGLRVFVFSNIGEHSAQILQEKYPEIFALFDGLLVTSAQDNYLMKPATAAFVKFMTKFQVDKAELIFIDDKQSNIYSARQIGIASIQFFNPHQCRRVLEKLVPSLES